MSAPGAEGSAEFEARYPGVCQHGDVIRTGETVRYSGGELEHVTCRDAKVKPTRFQGSTEKEMGY